MTESKNWKQHVADWRASGQTAEAYGEEHGIPKSRLWAWSSRVLRAERKAASGDEVRLVRVVRPQSAAEDGAVVTVELHDARVFVRPGADRTTLVAVLEAVNSVRAAGRGAVR